MNIKNKIGKLALTSTMIVGLFAGNLTNINAAGTPPTNWAFQDSSRPLEQAIIVAYPTVDTNADGYISIPEANALVISVNGGLLSVQNQALTGTIYGIQHFRGVLKINLSKNNFIGTIPAEIGNMTQLTSLEIYESPTIISTLPSEIGNLVNLTNFNISGGLNITGEIPSSFSNLTKLQTLYLERTGLSGNVPTSIFTLPKLTKVNFTNSSNLIGNISGNTTMSNTLAYIDIRGTGLVQVRPSALTVTTFLYDNLAAMLLNADGSDLADGVTQANIANAQASANYMVAGTEKDAWLANIAKAQNLLDAKANVAALMNTNKTGLADGVTQEQIMVARTEVNGLTDGSVKTALLADIALAQTMFDAQWHVNTLFTDPSQNQLAPGVTQAIIVGVQSEVADLVDGPTKDALNASLLTAQNLLNASNRVEALLNTNKDGLMSGVTQSQITASETLVVALPDGPAKTALQADVTTAQNILDATTKVAGLVNAGKTGLASGVTITDITAAQTAVGLVPSGPTKTALQQVIDLAKNLMDVTAMVDGLLTTDKTGLASGVTQADITLAQGAVSALPDGADKVALQANIDKAQSILDATNLVDVLLTTDKTGLKPGVSQTKIDAAQNAVSSLEDGTTKTQLQNDINTAKDILDATTKVGGLLNGDKTGLNPGVTQTDIDNAQTAIDKLPSGPAKDTLQTDVNKAKDIINALVDDATTKVDGLLNGDKTGLNPGVTQTDIDNAQTAIDKLPSGPAKDGLQNELDKAQDLLDQTKTGGGDGVYDALNTKAATDLLAKVNALNASKYTSSSYSNLASPKATVEAILASNVDSPLVRAAHPLQSDLDSAVAKLQTTYNALVTLEEDASNKVDELFNSDKTGLGDNTTQVMIDNAQNAVNKLPAGPLKDSLQADINLVQNMMDATNKVLDLLNDTLDGLNPGVGQVEIDAAQTAINKLPAGPTKDLLQLILDYAQMLLDNKGEVTITQVEKIKEIVANSKDTSVATADYSNILLWSTVAAISGAVFLARKKKYAKQ